MLMPIFNSVLKHCESSFTCLLQGRGLAGVSPDSGSRGPAARSHIPGGQQHGHRDQLSQDSRGHCGDFERVTFIIALKKLLQIFVDILFITFKTVTKIFPFHHATRVAKQMLYVDTNWPERRQTVS